MCTMKPVGLPPACVESSNLLVINVLILLTFQSFIYYNSSYNNYSQENSVYFIPQMYGKNFWIH